MEQTSFYIYLLIGITAGFLFGWLFNKLKSHSVISKLEAENNQLSLQIEKNNEQLSKSLEEKKSDISEWKNEAEKYRNEKEFLNNELIRKNSNLEHLQQKLHEQKAEIKKLQEKFSKEFENLANRIFEQKSEKFTSTNKENIKNILEPLQEKIKTFEEKVTKNNTDFIERNARLDKQLQYLNEQNLKISEEAINLTKALKGNTKMQGNWGEVVLERILERSGLQKDSEYFIQQNFQQEDGKRVMPDVIIHLPGDKRMIIDSKVSLNAYERYVNEVDENSRPLHLKNHLMAVRKRVSELSQKNYQNIYQNESLDFVLLFIPVEAAFALASNEYPQLYNEAFDQNIIMVTPTTLMAVLKTIDSMWQNEKQKQNAIEIASRAGALYDSFVNLTTELEKVGKQLGTVQSSYDNAMKKLTGKGNLIGKVEKLKKLGAKASKQIDEKHLKSAERHE